MFDIVSVKPENAPTFHPKLQPNQTHPYMRTPLATSIALTLGVAALLSPGSNQAGQPILGPTGKDTKDKMVAPLDPVPGSITIGGQFSEHLQSVYLDSLTPFWRPGNATVFLDTRNTYNDSHQYESSYGLGVRYLVPDHDVIFGVNAYYDSLDSQFDNQFRSFGFGAEVLTHWIDARFNYYLPDSDDILVGTDHDATKRTTTVGPTVIGNTITNRTTTRTSRKTVRTFESELEGWNAEIGFLIPGLDRYMETRVFGGYYHYNHPFTHDYEGFKARLEAHFLPGLIGNVEWWDDSYLKGSHWSAGLRAQVPFSFFNLFSGRNPFEGAGDAFRPRERDFRERLSDMVIRSHDVKTVTGDQTNSSQSTKTATHFLGTVPKPTPAPSIIREQNPG